ncbi:MAG: DevR family CRISPR-associated autoregulator [Thermoplasmata archaeon]
MAQVYEIGLVGRVRWELHSLNNEGTTGNVTEPRTLILADGTKTDGISGEMLQHIHVERMWQLGDKKKLCAACQNLQPTRIDRVLIEEKKTNVSVDEAIKYALTKCAICDLHGFLIQKPASSRNSTILFGWAVGVPALTKRDIHVHARHAPGEKARAEKESAEKKEDTKEVEEEEMEVQEQMVYNRPTRSGVYAIQSVFQPWRIGLNEVSYDYVISKAERAERYRLGLDAWGAMFPRTDGAMTTTRLPHVEDFRGVIVISRTHYPVPIITALNNDFEKLIERHIKATEPVAKIEIMPFNTIPEFLEKLNALRADEPSEL